MKVKVYNMTGNSGREIPNQFVIQTNEGTYFQSYRSIIVFESNSGKVQLDETYRDYYRTTGKYRNMFLNETKADTEKKISSGEYELTDLN
jgi:hypothetical protein